ncbi:MAG: 1-deoxy-D-xylulose-5-phosphate reductoisomerase [Clostridia bacterium]|nr:1-deoxy-D-xylulose-5-phosphate reductoisomerase [Clostridia bacterium]
MKKITVLGSTGSIGTQALEVIEKNGDLSVCALAAGRNIKLLEQQARRFKPEIVAVYDTSAAAELKAALKDTGIKVLYGESGVIEAAALGADIVLTAIVGIAGLKPTVAAIKAGSDIALANKETMVTAGPIINALCKKHGVRLLPVDSEHSAIFQSLGGAPAGALKRIILTASGGPFYGKTREELKNVTVAEALNHPNWSMGNKITIDSATLMNKGLEVIEAVHLFGVKPSDIEVLIHRQSILHSAVELADGAVIAQLGTPDMKIPIQYAFTYPERGAFLDRLSLSDIGTLTFARPDTETFKCLPLCVKAIEMGGLYPAAVNGANEQSVALFLNGKINFLQIAELNAAAMDNQANKVDYTLEDIFEADRAARQFVIDKIRV